MLRHRPNAVRCLVILFGVISTLVGAGAALAAPSPNDSWSIRDAGGFRSLGFINQHGDIASISGILKADGTEISPPVEANHVVGIRDDGSAFGWALTGISDNASSGTYGWLHPDGRWEPLALGAYHDTGNGDRAWLPEHVSNSGWVTGVVRINALGVPDGVHVWRLAPGSLTPEIVGGYGDDPDQREQLRQVKTIGISDDGTVAWSRQVVFESVNGNPPPAPIFDTYLGAAPSVTCVEAISPASGTRIDTTDACEKVTQTYRAVVGTDVTTFTTTGTVSWVAVASDGAALSLNGGIGSGSASVWSGGTEYFLRESAQVHDAITSFFTPLGLNDHGQVLVSGVGPNTNGQTHMFVISRSSVLTGQLKDPGGAPVVGTPVTVGPPAESREARGLRAAGTPTGTTVKTDKQGRFTLPSPPGPAIVTVAGGCFGQGVGKRCDHTDDVTVPWGPGAPIAAVADGKAPLGPATGRAAKGKVTGAGASAQLRCLLVTKACAGAVSFVVGKAVLAKGSVSLGAAAKGKLTLHLTPAGRTASAAHRTLAGRLTGKVGGKALALAVTLSR